MSSLYDVLGVTRDATIDELTTAWRQLSKDWQPDRHPGKGHIAKARLREIEDAYAELSDPDRRREYDGELRSKEFEFVSGDLTVVATHDAVRWTRGDRTHGVERDTMRGALLRRHELFPGWANVVVLTESEHHELCLPVDDARALARIIVRR